MSETQGKVVASRMTRLFGLFSQKPSLLQNYNPLACIKQLSIQRMDNSLIKLIGAFLSHNLHPDEPLCLFAPDDKHKDLIIPSCKGIGIRRL